MQMKLETKSDQVFLTQEIFSLLLDSMARPGKVNRMPDLKYHPPVGLSPYAMGIALTLLDEEIGFAVLPDSEDWLEYISQNTGCMADDVDRAEFIIVDGRRNLPEIEEMNRGDLYRPETGATLIMLVDKIKEICNAGDVMVQLRGAGIKDVRTIYLQGIDPRNLSRIVYMNREFPLGIDTMIIDDTGHIAAIPRSSKMTWEVFR
jgi:alpha-D-ribose 1-methylphosphonate 5-triphosphate synthase subunit PhnH